MASTRNVLRLFLDHPELQSSKTVGQVYRDLKAKPENVDPRNYVGSIMDAIVYGKIEDPDTEMVIDCLKRGTVSAIAPLLVQFGSYRNAGEVKPATLEEMAERYRKEGI